MDFMFLLFATLTLGGGLIMAFHQSIVHSAFALVATLFGVAGLYWTLGADFLGGLQILLYVGGVTVLLLFAVMLSTRDSTRLALARYVFVAPIVGFVCVMVLKAYQGVQQLVAAANGGAELAAPEPTSARIGELFLDPDGYLLAFEVVAVLLLLVLIGAVTVARRGAGASGTQQEPAA
jgi:NADH:ubiquinone oxidoreductase subunit 6 (subunit J)